MQSTTPVRSGFAILIGRPSAGKSSLINALCGHKVSIVSPSPQTTRNTIRGILNDQRGQVIFLDTPGLHRSDKKMNLRMRDVVVGSITEAEVAVYLIDATRATGEEEREIAALVRDRALPTVIAVTKCDERAARPESIRRFVVEEGLADRTVISLGGLGRDVSESSGSGSGDGGRSGIGAGSSDGGRSVDGRRGRRDEPPFDPAPGLRQLTAAVFDLLPEAPPWYPDEYYTDQEPHFRIAEIIREQAILRTREEVPHALYVEVADLEQKPKALWARTFIYVERDSQQGILVGKRGATITAIRREAERELNAIFPQPVRLTIQVKVRPRWRRNDELLQRLIQ